MTKDELVRRLAQGTATILDVRTEGEFSGELGAPCDPRQGHIPGARHLDVQQLLGLQPAAVRDLVGLQQGAEIVAYCHSGARSALAAEILRAAGYDARNYPGSWHEWSRDESLPAAIS